MKSPISSHNGQKTVWLDKNRFKVIVAGRRFGKSFLACETLLARSDKPKSINIYVAPTRQQAKDIIWGHLKKRILELKWRVKINESELRIIRANGSQIMLRTAEKPGRLRGLGIDYIVFDEYSEYRSKEIWTEVVRPALSDKKGHAMFIATPKGFNHLYDLFQNARTESNWNNFQFKTIDSPFFQTPEGIAEIEEAKKNLSERDFRQEYEASFEAHSGRIYYAFDRQENHIDYKYNPDLPIICGQDFNRSPMTSALYQKQNDKTLIQFSELFIRTGDTETTCRELDKIYPNKKILFRPDATGNRRTSNSSRSDFDIIRSYGHDIDTTPANPNLVDRWSLVNRCHEKKQVMVNIKNCPYTLKDREAMIYKEGTGQADLRDPFLGHMADAADYAIYREFAPARVAKIGYYT